MPGRIAACFRCAAAAAPSSGAGAAGPSLATSVYETHLGLVALSWSRTSLGLSLRAVLRLSPPPHSAPGSSSSASGAGYLDDDADEEEATLAFRARPWLLWRRRGSRRFRAGDRLVDLAWDLSRARFPGSGSPEPSSGFFVAVVVDGEMVLAAGDLTDVAYRRTRARRPPGSQRPVLLSRREHVSLRDAGAGRGHSHTTSVTVQGKEREISVDLVARGRGRDNGAASRDKDKDKERADVGMSVSVDGERVLHVRRLRWKFRGSERVDLGGGDGVQVSWDLHNWLFPRAIRPPRTPRRTPTPTPTRCSSSGSTSPAAAARSATPIWGRTPPPTRPRGGTRASGEGTSRGGGSGTGARRAATGSGGRGERGGSPR